MALFPRTDVGGLSVSRLVVGTNWFLGWSHASDAKDQLIRDVVRERTRIAGILTAFFEAGVDTVMGPFPHPPLLGAVHDAEDRSGVRAIIVSTPSFPVDPDVPAKGFDRGDVARLLDDQAEIGTRICMPHQSTTDSLVDRCTRTVRHAAGQLRPFQGLTFAWNAVRDVDMVTVGTMSVGDATEVIDLSLAILERRSGGTRLQETRSKQSVKRVLVR
jgi:hypothetical protein